VNAGEHESSSETEEKPEERPVRTGETLADARQGRKELRIES
jgi:hypothetical protein